MEAIVEILVEAYRENVAAAVAEHGDNITEEQRAVITDRFIHNFKTNLEVGLAAVFGNVEEKKPVTEVGVEDLLRKEEALMSVASRRKRYPKKAAMILEMIYKKNRKSLKELKVDLGDKRKLDFGDIDVDNQELVESYETASKYLKQGQLEDVENKEKAQRVVEAFRILKNAEEAAKVNDEVMNK